MCTLSGGAPLGTLTAPVQGSTNTFTFTVVCDAVAATANDYDITVAQVVNTAARGGGLPDGLNRLFPYTVDFKVDGATVPELSGTMSAVSPRNFRFTNDSVGGEVVRPSVPADTELNPAKGGNFLEFSLVAGGDTYEVTTLTQPLPIIGSTGPCTPATATPLTLAPAVTCPFFADDANGDSLYEFLFNIQGAGPLGAFDIEISSNGVVIPGGPQSAALTTTNELFQVVAYRATSADGPLVRVPRNAAFELIATWTGDATTSVQLAVSPPADANCLSTLGFICPNNEECTTSLFCATVPSTPTSIGVVAQAGTLSVTYEFFYNGVPFADLSTVSTGTKSFNFITPASFGAPPTQNGATPFVS